MQKFELIKPLLANTFFRFIKVQRRPSYFGKGNGHRNRRHWRAWTWRHSEKNWLNYKKKCCTYLLIMSDHLVIFLLIIVSISRNFYTMNNCPFVWHIYYILSNYNCLLLLTTLEYASKRKAKIRALVIGQKISICLPPNQHWKYIFMIS